MSTTTETEDFVIWRADLQKKLNVSPTTLWRWMRDGKLPPPDVDITLRAKGWRLSTLHNAGIRVT